MNNCTPILTRGKMTGTLRDNGRTFQKSVHSSRHFLRKPPAICLDVDNLRAAEGQGAVSIQIDDLDTGSRYTAAFALLWQIGVPMDRGYGRQIYLPLQYWSVDGKPPQAAPSRPKPAPEAAQLSFIA